ncbi:tetratricopeptide repeat protein [Kineosporia sp. R_H_3]|uniref:tetratricopeptide repeat protein n=1 Tax=Kineosporia sp. R_H_3 TaxID=1961848 RepID=UPI000B4A6FE1|nr:sel1 repeat family protein [Kineosporia sp. R_H_3]
MDPMYKLVYVQGARQSAYSTRHAAPSPTPLLTARVVATKDPVWPEDEDEERAELLHLGQPPIMAFEDTEAELVVRSVDVALPERVTAELPQDDIGSTGESLLPDGVRSFGFSVPVSFTAPDGVTLRRLRLELRVSTPSVTEPVFVSLAPAASASVTTDERATLAIEVAKLFPFLAGLGQPVSGEVKFAKHTTSVSPKIQVFGHGRNQCSWRVSDPGLAYGFVAGVVIAYSGEGPVDISAKLHVEVRKTTRLGTFRTYGKFASPMSYTFRPGHRWLTAFDSDGLLDPDVIRAVGLNAARAAADLAAVTGSARFTQIGLLHRDDDAEAAATWLRRAADFGDDTALEPLVRLLASHGPAEAEEICRASLRRGDTRPCVAFGDGLLATDPAAAQAWYRTAADAGSPIAMHKLAGLLEHSGDRSGAAGWYERCTAAAPLHSRDASRAATQVARLTEDWDKRAALRWYWVAAVGGDEEALARLRRLQPWRLWISWSVRRAQRATGMVATSSGRARQVAAGLLLLAIMAAVIGMLVMSLL